MKAEVNMPLELGEVAQENACRFAPGSGRCGDLLEAVLEARWGFRRVRVEIELQICRPDEKDVDSVNFRNVCRGGDAFARLDLGDEQWPCAMLRGSLQAVFKGPHGA